MATFEGSYIQALDDDGNPLVGAYWSFYVTNTTTPQEVYADSGLVNSLGYSVQGNAAGRFPPIYLTDDQPTRAILRNRNGSEILDIDPA